MAPWSHQETFPEEQYVALYRTRDWREYNKKKEKYRRAKSRKKIVN